MVRCIRCTCWEARTGSDGDWMVRGTRIRSVIGDGDK